MENRRENLLLLLYLAPWVVLSALSLQRRSMFLEHLENFSVSQQSILLIASVSAIAIYGALFHFLSKPTCHLSSSQTIFTCFIVVFLAFIPPMLSRDAATYMIAARNVTSFHVSPFSAPLSSAVGNDWIAELQDLWILRFRSFYGPLFLFVSLPFPVLGPSLLTSIALFKCFLAAVLVAMFAWLQKWTSGENAVLFLLNPAFLLNGSLEGHNDVLIAALIVWGVASLRNENSKGAAVTLGLAVGLKYQAALLLPCLLFRTSRFTWKLFFLGLLSTFVSFFAGALFLDFSFETLQLQLRELASLECFYGCTPPVRLFDFIFGASGFTILRVVGIALFALLVFQFLWKTYAPEIFSCTALLTAFFFETRWLTPWYFLPAIAVLFLLRTERRYPYTDTAVMLLTCYSMLRYFGV